MTLTVDLVLSGFAARLNHGNIGLATAVLVRGDRNILVDVGHVGRRPHLLQGLAARGLTPSDIDVVVLTHLHWDHAQNIELFDGSDIVVHEKELEWGSNPPPWDPATSRWLRRGLDQMNLKTMTGSELELEPGVSVVHAPGHTDGSVAVVVEAEKRTVIAGDAIASASSAVAGMTSLVFGDEDAARSSLSHLRASGDVIIPGHDRAFELSDSGEVTYVAGDATLGMTGTLDESSKSIEVMVQLQPRPGARVVR